MLRNPGSFGWDTRRRPVGRLADGQCHRKSNRRRLFEAARVKRCGKSAPREAQATRHGKPHRVQGQIGNRGAARSASAKVDRFRVSVAETNDSLRREAQTEFGLQPFQNHSALSPQGRRQKAEKISASGENHFCILNSAFLLPRSEPRHQRRQRGLRVFRRDDSGKRGIFQKIAQVVMNFPAVAGQRAHGVNLPSDFVLRKF